MDPLPLTPEDFPDSSKSTPRHCFACGSTSKTHLKAIHKNEIIHNTFCDLIQILNVSELFHKEVHDIFICDACVHLTEKIKGLESKCRSLNLDRNVINKRIIEHSPQSPLTKKPKTTDAIVKTSRRKLDFPVQNNDLTCNLISMLGQCSVTLSKHEEEYVKKNLLLCKSLNVIELVENLVQVPAIAKAVECLYLLKLDGMLDLVCRTNEPSILRTNINDLSDTFTLDRVLSEMKEK